MDKTLLCICVALLAGCNAYSADIDPDWTSYPREQVVQKPVRMWIAPTLFGKSSTNVNLGGIKYQSESVSKDKITIDYVVEQIGDKATKDIWIFAKSKWAGTEKKLLDRVPDAGQRACDGDYRITAAWYYFGNEATMSMMGRRHPALDLRFRCPVYSGKPANQLEAEVRQIAGQLHDSEYFDVIVKGFPASSGKLFAALKAVAVKEGMPVRTEGRTASGYSFLVAGEDAQTDHTGRIEQLAAIVADSTNGSVVAFLLPAFQVVYLKKRIKGRILIDETLLGRAPWNRTVAYERGLYFLSLVMERLR